MSSARITMVVAGEGRHLFDSIQDPRVRVVGTADAVAADVVVFPCGRYRRFDNVSAQLLPAWLRQQIAAGRAGLVFDTSLEGVAHKPDITAALHGVIQQLDGDPKRAAYVTQDRQYEADYRAHCATIGAVPVSVLTHDYWIWFALDQYRENGAKVFEHRLSAFRSRASQRERRFVSLNRTPRPSKILFLLRLLADGLWPDAFISFGGFRRKSSGPGKGRPTTEELARALPGFEDLIEQLAVRLDELDAHGRVLLGLEQFGATNLDLAQASTAVELEEYGRSWFSVITETEMRPRPSRITEKVTKPLVNFHPLLVLGNPGALRMIREYGFATFDDLFDESYDSVLDPRARFDQVYEQVVRCCRWPENQWQQAEARIAEKLEFNARWGLTEFPTTYRRRQDAMLVDRILAAVRSPL